MQKIVFFLIRYSTNQFLKKEHSYAMVMDLLLIHPEKNEASKGN